MSDKTEGGNLVIIGPPLTSHALQLALPHGAPAYTAYGRMVGQVDCHSLAEFCGLGRSRQIIILCPPDCMVGMAREMSALHAELAPSKVIVLVPYVEQIMGPYFQMKLWMAVGASSLAAPGVYLIGTGRLIPGLNCHESPELDLSITGDDRDISMLGLPEPLEKRLRNEGLTTVGKLIDRGGREIGLIRGVGRLAMSRLKECLASHGIFLPE